MTAPLSKKNKVEAPGSASTENTMWMVPVVVQHSDPDWLSAPEGGGQSEEAPEEVGEWGDGGPEGNFRLP